MSKDTDVTMKEIGGTTYVMKMIPTMAALSIVSKLEKHGFTPEVIFEVVSKGAKIMSADITQKKFDEHFAGKIKELMELFAEILKHNNLFPEAEGEEGNEDGSED